MGSGQPYLYDAPKRISADDPYNGFNPKAYTQAARQPKPKPKPKPEGPLIDFNRHPDSYLILPYGKTKVKPMSSSTKTWIKWVRWLQFTMRVLQLLGAIGMVVCVICIRGTAELEGWIIRIPPGVDILISLYAIYHLIRPAKGRTPGSSASYHFFSLVMDAGLIPFYVFIALMSNNHYREQPGTTGRWRTFFGTDDQTLKILLSTWLIAMGTGGLHIISLAFDLYLVVIFRKIARMPPDMNPLEDNLTSRRAAKHKHKNSSISVTTLAEKRMSEMSGTTISPSNRSSQVSQSPLAKDPLLPEPGSIPDPRTVPFFHTRNDSDNSFSPHNPTTARLSQVYMQTRSNRASQIEEPRTQESPYDAEVDDDNETLAQRRSFLSGQQSYSPQSKRNTMDSTQRKKYEIVSNIGTTVRRSVPPDNLRSDNWFIMNADLSEQDSEDSSNDSDDDNIEAALDYPNPTRFNRAKSGYGSLPRYSLSDDPIVPRPLSVASSSISSATANRPHMHPLAMNPPTPPIPVAAKPSTPTRPQSYASPKTYHNNISEPAAPTPLKHNSITAQVPIKLDNYAATQSSPLNDRFTPTRSPPKQDNHLVSQSPPKNDNFASRSPPKHYRFPSQVALKKHESPTAQTPPKKDNFVPHTLPRHDSFTPQTPPRHDSFNTQPDTRLTRQSTQSSVHSFNSVSSASTIDDPRALTPKRRQYGDLAGAMQAIRRSPVKKNHSKPSTPSQSPQKDQSPRVVSRTGVDESAGGWVGGWTKRSGREVSGKVAEEGRGWGTGGLVQRRVSGVA